MISFKHSKRHNTVEVAIVYQNNNDRSAFEAELNLVQELTNLMQASRKIHNWAHDPIVRPNVSVSKPDNYYASIVLKFPVSSRVEEEGEVWCYSYAGLHAVLAEIAVICKKHSANFMKFHSKLNLGGMKAPWVLPVNGHGVILREGSRQITYHGNHIPRSAVLGVGQHEVVQMMVLGEERAVAEFDKLWRRLADQYAEYWEKQQLNKTYKPCGPCLDLPTIKEHHTKIQWQNLGVFVCVKDMAGNYHWEQLGNMHNPRTVEYILNYGNHMLNTPLPFDNTSPLGGNNIFLNDHAYYSFESVI